ncbi:MAG: ABC transporter ATP-binding protein [Longimicrobiales bacterium]
MLEVSIARHLTRIDLDLTFSAQAEVLVLFGPSGAGKTTVLNCIAGLMRPDRGHIRLDERAFLVREIGQPYVDLPARRRRVGYVMQDYALFPHMSALENVRYPLRGQPDAHARAREFLTRMGIEHLAAESPTRLSGGQQQRVAIARALAVQSPLLLLDEPFAALDGPVRERLQRDLAALQRDLGLIVLLVTHRLEDAFALGHRIAVIQDGLLQQIGAVADVFHRPVNSGVAEIMGIRNLLRARVLHCGHPTLLDWDGLHVEVPQPESPYPVDTEVVAFLRPEDIKIVYADRPLNASLAHNAVDAQVLGVRQLAAHRLLQFMLPNRRIVEAHLPLHSYTTLDLAPGSTVRIALRRDGFVIVGRADKASQLERI